MIPVPDPESPIPAEATVKPAMPIENARAASSASQSRPPTGNRTASVAR